MAALTPQRHHLHGPRADPGDPPQAPPAALVIGVPQVDPSARHLPGDTCQRQRAGAGEVEGLKQRRRGPGQRRRRRQIAQVARTARRRRHTPAGPAPSEPSHHTALDLRGALVLDQLLAHRPRERLERLRAASDPQPRTHAHGASDQRVIREAAVKGAQSLVDPERESHPRDAVPRGRPRAGARAEQDPVCRVCATRTTTGLSSLVVQQPFQHPTVAAQHAVHAVARRQPVRTGRPDLLAQLDEVAQRSPPSRCTSTSSDLLPTICTSSPALFAERLLARRGRRLARRPRERRRRRRRCTRPTTAAPATKPPAATAAACTAGTPRDVLAAPAAPRTGDAITVGSSASTGKASTSSVSSPILRSVRGGPDC